MAKTADKSQEGRTKSIDNAMTQIQRQFGKGSIMRLGAQAVQSIPVIPTGYRDLRA